MSDTILHAILNMPMVLWREDAVDKVQRQSRYVEASARIIRLESELALARKGLEAVASLIDESDGVGGLHLNGDFEPWDGLRTGGWMETWLIDFDNALNAARSSNPTLHPPGCSAAEPR